MDGEIVTLSAPLEYDAQARCAHGGVPSAESLLATPPDRMTTTGAALTPIPRSRRGWRRSSASGAVLMRAGELRAYESDGLPGYQRRPSIAVFPGTRDETIAVVRLLARARGALRAARRGHRAVGRRARRRRRCCSACTGSRASSRSTRRIARAVVEPGVVNAHPDPRRGAVRPALRAGSVEPDRVHDRRQRRGERRRPALPQVRRHAQPRRSRVTALLPDGEIVTLGNARRGERRLRSARRVRRVARAASASRSTSRCGSSRNPQAVRTLLADFALRGRGGARGVGDHRRRASCRRRWR